MKTASVAICGAAALAVVIPQRGEGQELALGPASFPPPTVETAAGPLRLAFVDGILSALNHLADKKKTETVRCLLGGMRGGQLVIDLAVEPKIFKSDLGSVSYQSCPMATVALWHNHPRVSGIEPEHLCYLSRVDIQTALRQTLSVQIVQVRSGVLCGWTRGEIEAAADQEYLLARPSSRLGRPIDPQAVDCKGKARILPICVSREPKQIAASGAIAGRK